MTLRRFSPVAVGTLTALIIACTRVPSAEGPTPVLLPPRTDSPGLATTLRLPQETVHYTLRQTTTIRNLKPQDSAILGKVTTTALLSFIIDSVNSDSQFSFTVTADSLQITTEGSIPPNRAIPSRIGPLLRGAVADGRIVVTTALPDSLCAYSQLLTTAFQLVLPQLPAEVLLPLSQSVTDTVTTVSCRAGTRIELQGRRRLHVSKENPFTVEIEEHTELAGAGMIRRDSIIVSGEIRTAGNVVFQPPSRLPSLIRTSSTGQIQVRLGDSTTSFEQRSTHQLKRQP